MNLSELWTAARATKSRTLNDTADYPELHRRHNPKFGLVTKVRSELDDVKQTAIAITKVTLPQGPESFRYVFSPSPIL